MKHKFLGHLAGGSGFLVAAGTAGAAFTGLDFVQTVVDQSSWIVSDPRSLVAVDIYVTFDDPADQLIAVYGDSIHSLSISTTDPSGFYQAQWSEDTSAEINSALFAIFPSLAADSWVTITNTDQADNALLDIGIDFDNGFNNGGDLNANNGTWFITPEDVPQGVPVDGKVLIGRFTVEEGSTINGSLNLQYLSEGVTERINAQVFEFPNGGDSTKPDFDGDGVADIVWQNESDGRLISWQQWDGNDQGYVTGFINSNEAIDSSETLIEAIDMNSDGRSDIVWQNDSSVYVWHMDAWTRTSEVTLSSEDMSGWTLLGVADLDGDQIGDLIWQDTYSGDAANDGRILAWIEWDGTENGYVETFISSDPIAGGSQYFLGFGDIDGNGNEDLFWQGSDGSLFAWSMDGAVPSQVTIDSGDHSEWSVRAIGDFDGDGNSDLVLQDQYDDAPSTDGRVKLWQNIDGTDGGYDENWIYSGPIPIDLGWFINGSADYNGDGNDDILWRDGDGSLICWRMTGSSYQTGFLYSGSIPGWSVVAPVDVYEAIVSSDSTKPDFDGDGVADIVWQNESDGRLISWQQWDGNDQGYVTGFINSNEAIDSSETLIEAIDMNSDGRSDIVWQNDSSVYVWHMDAWTRTSEVTLSSEDMSGWTLLGVADLDGDQIGDLIWQDTYSGDAANDGRILAWIEWDGTENGYVETFISSDPIAGGSQYFLGFGDIDGNGNEDLFWQGSDGSLFAWSMDGAVPSQVTIDSGDHSEWSVRAIGDFDGDGNSDLVLQDQYDDAPSTDGRVKLWQNIDGTDGGYDENWIYSGPIPIDLGWFINGSADYNGDGNDDILWRDGDGSLICWRMTGSSYQTGFLYSGSIPGWSVVAPVDVYEAIVSSDSTKPDFDGDGVADIVWQNESDGRLISWQQWDGNDQGYVTGFINSNEAIDSSETLIEAIDMNSDGRSDIVWQNDSSVYVWHMDAWTRTSEVTLSSEDMSGWTLLGVADLDGDQIGDLIWQDTYSGDAANDGRILAWIEWDGTENGYVETFISSDPIAGGSQYFLGFGDIDGNGNEDLFWQGSDGSLFAWSMDGAVPSQVTIDSGDHSEWSVRAIGDFDGDGNSDLVLQDQYDDAPSTDGRVKLWQNIDGTDGGYDENWIYSGPIPIDLGWFINGSADYNGDGNDDILWRDGDGSLICWRMTGSSYQTGFLYSGSIPGWSVVAPFDVYEAD